MYEVEYTSEPETGDILSTGEICDYDVKAEFENIAREMDEFLLLVDMYHIIESCADDLLSISEVDYDNFWIVNKKLLNFVNAVYSYKEYLNKPSLVEISDEYYNNKMTFYRFICDFRNYIIHQSIYIQDYSKTDIFFKTDYVIKLLEEYQYPKDWQRKKANLFIKQLETKSKDNSLADVDKSALSMKKVTEQFMIELSEMKEKVLLYAFENRLYPALKWLLEKIYCVDGKYMYTFIVDKSNKTLQEPNYSYEWFFKYIIKSLGKNSIVTEEIIKFNNEQGYLYFYDDKCDVDQLLDDIFD